MYAYKYSVGRYKDYRPGYHTVDIKDYSVADLEQLFDILYIVIDDGFYKIDVCIQLEDYKLEFAQNPQMTINEWLTSQNGNNLKLSNIMPGDKYRYVKLERVFTHGYFHYPADLNLAKDRQELLLSDSAPDIRVAHYALQNIDYADINDHALFTFNGCFVRSYGRADGIYLMGAGSDYIAARNDVRIGALNFEKLGKVKTIPITADNLAEVEVGSRKRWEFTTDITMENKTVWLVVNGQLVCDSEMVYRVADDRVAIDLTSFDVSRHFLTYSKFIRTPKLTNLTKFDVYKREALVMQNSFIVLIDNPSLGIDVTPLTTFRFPNALHTENRFEHPLLLECGMFPVPYRRSYGIKQRLLNHDVRIYYRYPQQTGGTLDGNVVLNPAINQGVVGHMQKGYLFKIHGIELRKTQ